MTTVLHHTASATPTDVPGVRSQSRRLGTCLVSWMCLMYLWSRGLSPRIMEAYGRVHHVAA